MSYHGIVTWLPFLLIVLCSAIVPPKEPPPLLMNDYTLNDTIPIEYFYVDDTYNGNQTFYKFSATSMQKFIDNAQRIFQNIEHQFSQFVESSGDTMQLISYLSKDYWLYYTFCKNNYEYSISSIQNKKVGVIGSMTPWIEAMNIYLGADKIVTFEYNLLHYVHEKITHVSGIDNLNRLYNHNQCDSNNNDDSDDYDDGYGHCSNLSNKNDDNNNNVTCYLNYFDTLFVINSLDHDGLGRYGDPIHPDADINTLGKFFDLLVPGGLLFLTVPIGPDLLIFNTQRRYGPIRLQKLIKNYNNSENNNHNNKNSYKPSNQSVYRKEWIIKERLFWDEDKLYQASDWRHRYEPIFVLQKPMID